MQTFLDKQADNDLELDVGLASNGSLSLTNGTGPSKKMKKSVSESALSMKTGRRDSPLSSVFGMSERTAEISYDWVQFITNSALSF